MKQEKALDKIGDRKSSSSRTPNSLVQDLVVEIVIKPEIVNVLVDNLILKLK